MSVGSKCPTVKDLHIIKGDPVQLGAPQHSGAKRAFVVEFWATWCPPCRQSIPHLTELQRKYKDKEVYIVGISTEKELKRLEQFVKQMGSGMEYTVAADPSGSAESGLYLQSSATGIPYAFVIDVSGTITWAGHPMDPAMEAALEAAALEAGVRGGAAQQALGPITASEEELGALPVKALKALLAERGVAHADCLEKADLVARIRERCSSVTYYK